MSSNSKKPPPLLGGTTGEAAAARQFLRTGSAAIPEKKRVQSYLSMETARRLEHLAVDTGASVSALVEEAVEDLLRKRNPP